ncbi:MAG: hypothetical protein SOY91_05050 [Candidatus Onthomorpha sp.]|nr:hypothetical protein [Candidatus Onthomorpha sp.]
MKRLSFYSFLCAVLLMSVNVFGQFAGGNGTLANPYQVKTASQFAAIAGYPNAFFVQIDNITFENNTDFPKSIFREFMMDKVIQSVQKATTKQNLCSVL